MSFTSNQLTGNLGFGPQTTTRGLSTNPSFNQSLGRARSQPNVFVCQRGCVNRNLNRPVASVLQNCCNYQRPTPQSNIPGVPTPQSNIPGVPTPQSNIPGVPTPRFYNM